MWLTNYFNLLFATLKTLMSPYQQAIEFPAYQKISGVLVNSGTGTRQGANGNISHNAAAHIIDALAFGAVGSLTAPAASQTSVVSQVIFGTGTTPATESDYMLEAMITSGIAFSLSSGFDSESKAVVTNLTVTCTDAAKDVSEIGLAFDQVLVYRKVLENPIHLEVGDSFVVKLTVDIGTGNATVSV